MDQSKVTNAKCLLCKDVVLFCGFKQWRAFICHIWHLTSPSREMAQNLLFCTLFKYVLQIYMYYFINFHLNSTLMIPSFQTRYMSKEWSLRSNEFLSTTVLQYCSLTVSNSKSNSLSKSNSTTLYLLIRCIAM